MNKITPIARTTGIVVQDFKHEVLIYDLRTNKAYALNETSTAVWQLCDGNNSIDKIADLLSIKFKELVSEDIVLLSLELLKKENLLEAETVQTTSFEGLTRREAVRKIGFSALVTLPVISILVAPSAINAQSLSCPGSGVPGNPNNCPCAANGNCTSACCGVNSGGAEVCVTIDATPVSAPCRGNCECAGASTCPSCVGLPRICRIGGCPP